MSDSSNAEIVRRFLKEGVEGGNADALDEFLHPELSFHGGSLGDYGIDVFKENLSKFWEAFPDLNGSVEDLFENGDRVAVRLKVKATHRGAFAGIEPTGKQVEWMDMLIYRLEDGVIVEEWALVDVPHIVAQLNAG
jgi:predicted ester cyclase